MKLASHLDCAGATGRGAGLSGTPVPSVPCWAEGRWPVPLEKLSSSSGTQRGHLGPSEFKPRQK